MSAQTYLRGYNGDAHSTENQRILDKLVHREVVHRASELVSLLDHIHSNDGLPTDHVDSDDLLSILISEDSHINTATNHGAVFTRDIDGEWWCINPSGMEFDLFSETQPPPGYTVTQDFGIIESGEDGEVHHACELSHQNAVARAWSYWACDLPNNVSTLGSDKASAARDYCDENDLEPERSEVYEHWIVTEFFAEHLSQRGEAVGEVLDFHIWGRTTTGQSISLDPVIADVAAEMEILVGQRNSWEERATPFPPNPEFHPSRDTEVAPLQTTQTMESLSRRVASGYSPELVTRAYRMRNDRDTAERHFIEDRCYMVRHDGAIDMGFSWSETEIVGMIANNDWVTIDTPRARSRRELNAPDTAAGRIIILPEP